MRGNVELFEDSFIFGQLFDEAFVKQRSTLSKLDMADDDAVVVVEVWVQHGNNFVTKLTP